MRSTWLFVLLLVLSGCQAPGDSTEGDRRSPPPAGLDETDDITGKADSNATPRDVWSLPRWEFIDCWLRGLTIPTVKALVDAEVPAGYSLQSAFGDGVSTVIGLNQFTCDALVVGNDTIVAPVNWAFSGTYAQPTDMPPNATGFPVYQFEWFIDNKTAAELLRARGFNARFASLAATQNGESLMMHISVEGTTWYRAEGHLGTDTAPANTYTSSHFHGENYVFANLVFRSSAGALKPYSTVLEASEGALSRIGTGTHAGEVYSGEASVSVFLQPFQGDA